MFAILAPIGYFATPFLLTLVNAAPEVRAQALPFLRINFVFSIGMLLFFMLSAALRAAGDAKTPLRLGVTMTVLNLVFNLALIPKFGTAGSAMGTAIASALVSSYALWLLFNHKLVVHFSRETCTKPDWTVIRSLFKFGLPTGVQGIAMNVAGVLLLRFIGSLEHSAAAQAAFTIGYTELFSMITWTSVGLMGAAATIAGQNLGAGQPDRALHGVYAAAKIGLPWQRWSARCSCSSRFHCSASSAPPRARSPISEASCCATSPSRASSSALRSPSPAASRARVTPRARSTSRSCRRC